MKRMRATMLRFILFLGVICLALQYAWFIAVGIYLVVAWFSLKTEASVQVAKEQGVVAQQPQPYPDMSFRWNVSVNSYLRGDITAEELDRRVP